MADCLMIFAKAPVLGRCKTRLKLPDEHAMALHCAFVEDVIESSKGDWNQVIWSDDACHPFFQQFGLPVRQQVGPTLGDRMANAFAQMLPDFERIVVIGTDAPSLPVAYLKQAFESPHHHDAVLGPSCDGGYYSLGLIARCDAVFDPSIPWGQDTVCVRTLEILKRLELNTALLPFWFDVDRPQDLALLRVLGDGTSYPRSTKALAELGLGGVHP